jgi:hypothetical protein
MRVLVILFCVSSCNGGTCPEHVGDELVDGAAIATLTDTNETFTLSDFVWDGNPPNVAGSGAFRFVLGYVSVRCNAPSSAYDSTQPVPLSTLSCSVGYGVDVESYFEAPLTAGTMHATSALDQDGVGVLDVFLDVPETSVTIVADDGGGAQHTVVVRATGLHGRAQWIGTSCGDPSCSGAGVPVL